MDHVEPKVLGEHGYVGRSFWPRALGQRSLHWQTEK